MRRQPREMQEFAGHASLVTTQRYMAGDAEAKRRVVALKFTPMNAAGLP